jgi:hypothetical protein
MMGLFLTTGFARMSEAIMTPVCEKWWTNGVRIELAGAFTRSVRPRGAPGMLAMQRYPHERDAPALFGV